MLSFSSKKIQNDQIRTEGVAFEEIWNFCNSGILSRNSKFRLCYRVALYA